MLSPARSSENCGELQNIHTLFRREIDLENGAIQCAGLFITADDYYKLYINGNFVGGGPALAHPRDYHYNGWDVTDLLRDGKTNCIGMHVYYQGLYNLAFISGDNLQGMLLQLEIELEDGSRRTVVSDQNWRCHQTDAYEGRQLYGYQTAFSEHIDLRRFPAGWNEPGFDDRGWTEPHCAAGKIPAAYRLSPRAPGWSSIDFSHRPPAELESAELCLTVPPGEIEAAFQREGETVVYHLRVPDGCTVTCRFPTDEVNVRVDGKDCAGSGETDERGLSWLCVPHDLFGGQHTLRVPRSPSSPAVQKGPPA